LLSGRYPRSVMMFVALAMLANPSDILGPKALLSVYLRGARLSSAASSVRGGPPGGGASHTHPMGFERVPIGWPKLRSARSAPSVSSRATTPLRTSVTRNGSWESVGLGRPKGLFHVKRWRRGPSLNQETPIERAVCLAWVCPSRGALGLEPDAASIRGGRQVGWLGGLASRCGPRDLRQGGRLLRNVRPRAMGALQASGAPWNRSSEQTGRSDVSRETSTAASGSNHFPVLPTRR
jgi:hypothetical protein